MDPNNGGSDTPSYLKALPASVQHALMIGGGYGGPAPYSSLVPSTTMMAAAPPTAPPPLPPIPPLVLSPPPPPPPPPPPSLLITPPPPTTTAGPPLHHIFQGTKAANVSCASCGAAHTGGGCWRRGWALVAPQGSFASLCNKCGLKMRHGKLKPPMTGPYAAVVGWRTVTPPRRVRSGAAGGGRASAASVQAAAAGPLGSSKGGDEGEQQQQHPYNDDYSADEYEDEAAAAAWTLLGMAVAPSSPAE